MAALGTARTESERIRRRQELERTVLHGLALEWDMSAQYAQFEHGIEMRAPGFRLADFKKRLGLWSAARREIAISREFALSHPWRSVVDVLRHEMAHQLVDVAWGTSEKPHGPAFRKACAILRADPRASGDYEPLDDWIGRGKADQDDRMLARVRKLLALGQSANQHEAELALRKAQKLIEKYNLNLLAKDKRRSFHSLCVGAPALRHHAEEHHLSRLLREFYFVRTIWVPMYVCGKGKMGRVLEMNGTAENLKIASYVHDFVRRFIDREWERYTERGKLSRHRKTDFAIGVIEGFSKKLEALEKGAPEQVAERALVKADPKLEVYYRLRHPRIRKGSGWTRRRDEAVQEDGRRIGKQLVVHQGIETDGVSRPRLLGAATRDTRPEPKR